jgi:hypothetical protein
MLSRLGGVGQNLLDKSNNKYTSSKDFSKENLAKDKIKRETTLNDK